MIQALIQASRYHHGRSADADLCLGILRSDGEHDAVRPDCHSRGANRLQLRETQQHIGLDFFAQVGFEPVSIGGARAERENYGVIRVDKAAQIGKGSDGLGDEEILHPDLGHPCGAAYRLKRRGGHIVGGVVREIEMLDSFLVGETFNPAIV